MAQTFTLTEEELNGEHEDDHEHSDMDEDGEGANSTRKMTTTKRENSTLSKYARFDTMATVVDEKYFRHHRVHRDLSRYKQRNRNDREHDEG